MERIFSWDPSSKIIFLHVVLGEGGRGVVSVFSRFRRSFLDKKRNDLAGKRLCLKMTAKSYSDFLNYITNYFLAICKEPKRVLLSIDWMHRQIISALIVHKLRYRHGIFPLKNEFWAQELRLISTTGRICSKTVVRLRFCNALRQCSWCHRTNKFFG